MRLTGDEAKGEEAKGEEAMRRFWRHPWTIAVSNIALLMVVYTFSRLFFYLVNLDLFPEASFSHIVRMFVGGLRFDTTAVMYMSALYLAMMLLPLPWAWRTHPTYQKVAKWALWVPNFLGIFCNAVDCVYVRFTHRRTSLAFFSEFENETNLVHIFFTAMVQYWYVSLFFIALTAAFVLLTRTAVKQERLIRSSWFYYIVSTIVFVLSSLMIILGIRSSAAHGTRPINISDALKYVDVPQETMVVLNTPFSLMRASSENIFHPVHYYEDDVVDTIMTPERAGHSQANQPASASNVMIIILESFSKEYIGFFHSDWHDGTYRGYTPFLDSLLAQSHTYVHSFATGCKSIDALPSILSSIPMLQISFVTTPYATNTISSITQCLGEQGYHSAFFHGGIRGSMGFEAYAHNAGFESLYSMSEYHQTHKQNDYDGSWAIWDEEFLQFTAQVMDTIKEPFITSVFTATSHHPYRIPKHYQDTFPEEDGLEIHKCIRYSDHALRRFFDYAQSQPWFDRTLFVITADHTNQLQEPVSRTMQGIFEVPILFYYSGMTPCVDSTTLMSQVDIMPTVLTMMGYTRPYFSFGESAIGQGKEHNYAISYRYPIYQILSDSLLVLHDGQNITSVYHRHKDPLFTHSLDTTGTGMAQSVADMETYLKAYIQQYFNRMIENRLTYGNESR